MLSVVKSMQKLNRKLIKINYYYYFFTVVCKNAGDVSAVLDPDPKSPRSVVPFWNFPATLLLRCCLNTSMSTHLSSQNNGVKARRRHGAMQAGARKFLRRFLLFCSVETSQKSPSMYVKQLRMIPSGFSCFFNPSFWPFVLDLPPPPPS